MTLETVIVAFYNLLRSAFPVLLVLALFFFIFNVFRYFVIEGGSDDGREKAKRLAKWGILALVLLFGFWGIVSLLMSVFGFGGTMQPVIPDYMGQAG